MNAHGFLGIDVSTQGLTVLLVDQQLNVVAAGNGNYEMVAGLDAGCYEQHPQDWLTALQNAMADLRAQLGSGRLPLEIRGIGVAGQMHGEVLTDQAGQPLSPARLWCDARNEVEGQQLTELFGVKVPKRMTVARWLWTLNHRAELARQTFHITTPAGWMTHQLTGHWQLGIGDASGMFPIDQLTFDYDVRLLEKFDQLARAGAVRGLRALLPEVRIAGQDAGTLSVAGAELLQLSPGISVAAAEGDQPAALAGSFIGQAGMVSVSFGTSVCANSVGDRSFAGVIPAVDHFCAVDGKPINMVFLRNGTTFMNRMVELLVSASGADRAAGFAAVMPEVIQASADCGGLLAVPFLDDEPGLGIRASGSAMLVGFQANNATPGNVIKASLLATAFNLLKGSQALDEQGFPRSEIILSGGLTKTPQLGQVIADIFRCQVSLLEGAEEGTAFGAALLSKYRRLALTESAPDWSSFLAQHAPPRRIRYQPCQQAASEYDRVYRRYLRLLENLPAPNITLTEESLP